MEMPLAEAALRSGVANEFEQHIQPLENRCRRILNCTPRVIRWLVTFSLEIVRATQTRPRRLDKNYLSSNLSAMTPKLHTNGP